MSKKKSQITKSQVRAAVHRIIANLAGVDDVSDGEKLGHGGVGFDSVAIDNLRGDLNQFLDEHSGGHIGEDQLSESTTVGEVVDLVAGQLGI